MVTLFMIPIIAVLDSTRVFRLARAVGMNIVVMDFFEAQLRGEKLSHLIFSEITPNAFVPLLAEFGLRFCSYSRQSPRCPSSGSASSRHLLIGNDGP